MLTLPEIPTYSYTTQMVKDLSNIDRLIAEKNFSGAVQAAYTYVNGGEVLGRVMYDNVRSWLGGGDVSLLWSSLFTLNHLNEINHA